MSQTILRTEHVLTHLILTTLSELELRAHLSTEEGINSEVNNMPPCYTLHSIYFMSLFPLPDLHKHKSESHGKTGEGECLQSPGFLSEDGLGLNPIAGISSWVTSSNLLKLCEKECFSSIQWTRCLLQYMDYLHDAMNVTSHRFEPYRRCKWLLLLTVEGKG